MKKLIAILMIAALCIGLSTAVSAADGPFQIKVNVDDIVIGSGKKDLTVEIEIVNTPGLSGVELALHYPEWAKPVKAIMGPSAPEYPRLGAVEFDPINYNKNPLKVNSMHTKANFTSGVYAVITFEIDESAIKADGDNRFYIIYDGEGVNKSSFTGDLDNPEAPQQPKPTPVPEGQDGDGSVKITCGGSHAWGNWETVTEAECEKVGSKKRTCGICGTVETAEIPATGHTWDAGKITKDPKCTEDGVKTFTCTKNSNHTRTETVAKLGHESDGEWHTDANKHWHGCTRCDAKLDEDVHSGGTPTCVEMAVCSVCENKYGGINSDLHDWDEGKVTKDPTCEGEGVRTYTCKRDPNHPTKDEPIAALDHDWDEGKVTTDPTCTKKGEKTFTCNNDKSHTYTEEVKELGHDWGKWVGEDGVHKRSCSRCPEVQEEAHNFSEDYKHDKDAHWHECTVCSYPSEKK